MKKLLGILALGLLWCNISFSEGYRFYSYEVKDYGDVMERHFIYGEEYVVTQKATHHELFKVNPETKEKKSIKRVYSFEKFAEECVMLGSSPVFFAYVKEYYFAGGHMVQNT